MELTLTIEAAGTGPRPVRASFDPASDAAELTRAAAEVLGIATASADPVAWVARTGQAVAPGSTLADAHLVEGDALYISFPGDVPSWAGTGTAAAAGAIAGDHPFELQVVGGPDAGRRVPLRAGGSYVIGRDPGVEVPLGDGQASRQHCHLGIGSDRVVLTDLGSTNGTLLDGRRVEAETELAPGRIVEVGATLLTIAPTAAADDRRAQISEAGGRLSFNRPPRVSVPVPKQVVRMPMVPAQPQKRRLPIAVAVVPLLLGFVLAYFLGPVMLLFSLMGPVMMGASIWEDRRSGHKDFREACEAFDAEMAELEVSLDQTHRDIIDARRAAAPSVPVVLDRIVSQRPELWEHRPRDADFLTVRIGSSDLPSNLSLDARFTDESDPDMVTRVEALMSEYQVDPDVPVDVDVRGVGVLGVTGEAGPRNATLRWLTLQATAFCSPRDLAVVLLCPRTEIDTWSWMRWLPHTETLFAGMPGARTVAASVEDVRSLFQVVDDLIVGRRIEAERRIGFGDNLWAPHVLLVVPGEIEIPRPSLSRVLSEGPAFGVSVLVGAPQSEHLPGECRAVVATSSTANTYAVTVASSGDTIPGIVGDAVSLPDATAAARALAPLRDVSAASVTGDVPRQCLLLDVIELEDPSPDAVRQRWSRHREDKGLEAPIGMGPAGTVSIDLRRDGPHGLAAGTTGAGKSELLQSYVAALAATYPPDKLTFVLVDYKGGAAFKDCVDLPHTVGFFTDLDSHLAQRALVSLNAELRRREEILREHGAKDLIDLERRDPVAAPANLLIVFDEFAFLKKEVPEFVAGVIDIAQRGRSLGVHLLLATQRPSGVVDDHIRANTNLRIALRIADEVDSNDVIDRPDAAHIPKTLPGRGYIRTGHSEVTVVQSAFGGARSGGDSHIVATTVVPAPFGTAGVASAGGGGAEDEDRPTDLQRLVAAIATAAVDEQVPPQPLPWLNPLADTYELGALLAAHGPPAGASELCATLGVMDLPDQQSQHPWPVDLGDAGHLLVYGTAGSGKTTLLRTLAAGLASRFWPTDLWIYALDYASRGLSSLESLPHCGGVVSADELERTERLFVMLEQLTGERKDLLGRAGAATLAEYRAVHGPTVPYVVLLLDGYAAFSSVFQTVDHGELLERLNRIVSEGRSVGIHVVVTADRRNAVPSSLSGVITERIVLEMADADEYATLGLPMSIAQADLPPGRAFVEGGREVQLAVLGDDHSGAGQNATVQAWGEHLAASAAAAGVSAEVPGVSLLPDQVSLGALDAVPVGSVRVPIGRSGITYGTSYIDLADNATFLVLGPDRSGRSNALVVLASGAMGGLGAPEAYLLAPRRSQLTALDGWTEVATGLEACEDLAVRIAELVRERVGTNPSPMLVVLDDGDELTEGRGAMAIETIAKRGRDAGVILLAASQTHVVHRSFGGWLTDVRKAKHGLFLAPDVELDGELLGVRLPRKTGRAFPAGRAYVVRRGAVELVQVALAERAVVS